MGKYQNGIETREKILDACRKLFYEKGYDNTTFMDICRETGINQSAIHYHFKSKENLLRLIQIETVEANNRLVEFYSDRSTCFRAKFFFDTEIYLYKIYKDEKYRRFYRDATRFWYDIDDTLSDDTHRMGYDTFYKSMKLDGSGNEDVFNRMTCVAFDQMILIYIDKNIESIDFKQILGQVTGMYKKILEITDEEYAEALADLHILEERCKWEEIDTTLQQ